MVMDEISRALGTLKFSTGSVHSAKNTMRSVIHQMWIDGKLPIRVGKQWIVGYYANHSFFSTSITPILVGPKKPSKFRDHYAGVVVKVGF